MAFEIYRCGDCGYEKEMSVQAALHPNCFKCGGKMNMITNRNEQERQKREQKREQKRANERSAKQAALNQNHVVITQPQTPAHQAKMFTRQEKKQLKEIKNEQALQEVRDYRDALQADPKFQELARKQKTIERARGRAANSLSTTDADNAINKMESIINAFTEDMVNSITNYGVSDRYVKRFTKKIKKEMKSLHSSLREARQKLRKAQKLENNQKADIQIRNIEYKTQINIIFNTLGYIADNFSLAVGSATLAASCRLNLPDIGGIDVLNFHFREKKIFGDKELTQAAQKEICELLPKEFIGDS